MEGKRWEKKGPRGGLHHHSSWG